MPLTPPLLLPPHTEKNLKTFQQHVTGYVSALRDTCSLQTNVSGDLLYFFEAKSENPRPRGRLPQDVYSTSPFAVDGAGQARSRRGAESTGEAPVDVSNRI